MDLIKKLKDQGWHLTEDGLKKLQAATNNTDDVRKLIEAALNIDFREIGGGALPTKREEPTLSGNIVLQIQRVRNISAPKSNEESKAAPRFLQLDLSDGQTAIQALELEPVSALNLNIAPGTKIYFRTATLQLMQGFIILRSADIQVLGGRVEALYDKWDLARTMQKYARSGRRMMGTGSSAPPPFVAFGKKTSDRDSATADRNFKSLTASQDKDKEVKENDEFNAMRSEAIAVASKAGNKKVFGGGGQNLVDHNVKKILDKGYSEEDAKYALRATNNNLERALYNLKRRSERKSGYEDVSTRESASTTGRPLGGRRGMSSKDEPEASKPAANVSLFDFLTNKLPVTETQPVTTPTQTTTTTTSNAHKDNYVNPFRQPAKSMKPDTANDRTKFENNISTSFAANRSTSTRGGATNGRGRGDRPPRGGNTETMTRSDDSKADSRRNTMQRKPPKELSNNTDKRRDDIGDNTRRKEAPHRSKGGYENKRENERHGSFNQRSEHVSNDNRASGTNRNTLPPSNVNTHSKNNEEHAKNMDKLIENTSNMKLTSKPEDNRGGRKQKPFQQKRQTQDYHSMSTTTTTTTHHGQTSQSQRYQRQQPQQHASTTTSSAQQQQQQQSSSSNASYQNANGYSYDPTKIIGFQSKETNEFAMSLLKSQGVGVPAGTTAPPPTQFQQTSAANTTPSFMSMGTHYAAPNFVVPGQQPALHSPQGFNMNPGDGWMWKIGDLCLAKYWDDGQYYESEITAISDKTCVVFFLGYGNHEEVLKSDCLPITDGNHMPLNSLNANQAQVPASGNVYARRSGGGSGSSGGGSSQRYRGERQMYVPPPKRDI